MDNLNNEDILDRPFSTMWPLRDPTVRTSGVGNICIKNLDPSITAEEINDTFANFGEISSCKVPTDENGVSEGVAYVNFNVEADAEKAISVVNGKIIRDKIVHVSKLVPKTQKITRQKDFTNCYVRNLGAHLQDKDLRELFDKFGEVFSAKVIVDEEGNSGRIGLVSYKEHKDALTAVNTLNGRVVGDKPIYVGPAMAKAERQGEWLGRYKKTCRERLQHQKSEVNLFVKNLHDDIDDKKLRKEFSVFGNVTSAKVMLNEENTSKGFGCVVFSAPDEATRAVSEMNGKIVKGKRLYVALAQKKGDRVAQQLLYQPQSVLNPGLMTLNPRRTGNILPQNMPYIQPRNIGMPANQNIMMAANPQNQQKMNRIVDPLLSQNRNARPIASNVQLNETRPQYNIVATSDGQGDYMNTDQKKKPGIESQIDLAKLANADSMEAKQLLGEKIYPLVSKHAGDMAGKITGMFLELDNAELLYMIENENSLRMKIDEALLVLNNHNGEIQNKQNRNVRTTAGNVQLNQPRPQCSIIETGRQGDDGPTFYAG